MTDPALKIYEAVAARVVNILTESIVIGIVKGIGIETEIRKEIGSVIVIVKGTGTGIEKGTWRGNGIGTEKGTGIETEKEKETGTGTETETEKERGREIGTETETSSGTENRKGIEN